MAIYYVRQTGNDLNNGTSPNTAWRTFVKALSSSGATSGDIVYIGAGTYREIVTIGMTSATSEVQLVGDLDGIMTGDAGEIKLTSYLFNDESVAASRALVTLNAKDFLTFKNITFVSGSFTSIDASASSSTNIQFINCIFLSGSAIQHLNILVAFGVPANWIIDRCIFTTSSNQSIFVSLGTGTGVDYDANILIKNSIFYSIGGTRHILIQNSGSSANEGGGVRIYHCSFYGIQAVNINSNRVGGVSFQYPIEIINCLLITAANSAISAAEVGNTIENYNIVISHAAAPKPGIISGPQSVLGNIMYPILDVGQSFITKYNNQIFGSLKNTSPFAKRGIKLNGINDDFVGINRPMGTNTFITSGIITSSDLTSISDTSKNFGSSGTLRGNLIRIIEGAGAGQIKTIYNNDNNIVSGDGAWVNIPDTTSKYIIYNGLKSTIGYVTGSVGSTVSGSGVNWATNYWQGYTCMITSGVASGQNFIISGNNIHTLSGYYPMNPSPSINDVYSIYYGGMMAGTVTSATSTTLTDNTMSWPILGTATSPTGFWKYWRCMITDGVGVGSNFCISGSDNNTLSGYTAFNVTPQIGDKYIIFQNTGGTGYYNSGDYPIYNQYTLPVAIGAFEVGNTALRETGVVLSGNNAIKLFGPSCQDFTLAVSGNTTISIYSTYDQYYSGVKPQLIIRDGSGIGIPDSTGTMNGGMGQWEAITLNISPISPGVITTRLQSNTTGLYGSAYFDCFNIV